MIVERLNYNMSDVKTDDSTHRYYNVGSYINTTDDGTSFTSTDITVRSKDPEDLCDYKTSRTNLKTGFAANGWHLGLKERITDTQHLLKASQIMGVARTDGTVTYETLSSLPDVGLTMDASTYRVDFNDYFSLKFFPVNAGGGAEHIFKKKLVEDYPLYDYYGVR